MCKLSSTFRGKQGHWCENIFCRTRTECKVSVNKVTDADACSFAEQHQVLQHCLTPTRKCLTHIAVLMLKLTEFMFVDRRPALVVWPTFFPPTLQPSWPCFSLCGRICHIFFLGMALDFFKEGLFSVYHGSSLMHTHTAATHGRQWPSSKQWVCQSQQILKNNIWVLYKTP